jgi:hypothetical protein
MADVSRQMSLTFENVSAIATQQLSALCAHGAELSLLADATKEFDEGWVFYYQSARFLESRDPGEALAGNAPLFVARSNGASFFVSYHRPLAESLAAYRACGNPNARQLPEVRFKGWIKGAIAVSAIHAVRQHSAAGLAQAKGIVDACLANQSPVVAVSSVREAQALVLALDAAGFKAEVGYDG